MNAPVVGEVDRDDVASGLFRRRKFTIADVRRERFGVSSTAVLPGAAITVPAGGNGIFVCVSKDFAYNVIPVGSR